MMPQWEPFLGTTLNRLRNEMDQLFGRFGALEGGPGLAHAFPPVNVWEDGEKVYAEAELPGMKEDDLEIYVAEGNQLTIRGERKPFEGPKGTWHRQERGFGKFSRVITLPAAIDADKVEAQFEQGVLLLTLPKSEVARPRRISVKAE